jgi:putative spermidine/putrescine transport system permease protein
METSNINYYKRIWRLITRLILWGIAFLILLPLVPVILWSFANKWFWPDVLPTEWGLRSWESVFSPYSQVGSSIAITLTLGVITVFLTILVSLPAAKAIGQNEFRGKGLLETLILAPYLVSPTAVAFGLYTVFIRFGLQGTVLGVSIAMLIPTTPLMLRLLISVFESFDPEFEEQAKALGASPFRVLIHVTIPMILPGIIAGSLFTFLGAINAFFYPFLIGAGRVNVLAVLLYNYMGAGGYDFPVTAAISIILAIPGILFILFSEKLIREEYFALGFGAG